MTDPQDDYIPEDLTPSNMDDIRAERARMFTLGFWKSLLAGHEGMGDTFWAGNYLAALFFIPVYVLLLAIPPLYGLFPYLFAAFGVYLLFVARAVAKAQPKGKLRTASRWKQMFWKTFGVAWTLMNATMCLTMSPFTGGV
ncbi:hypothetical protein [Celeribacter halophilus]|uniref:hypothetical protein n=1 Tax=Celeribacter halophilus TaxID=576117 RepID=UPI003A95C334